MTEQLCACGKPLHYSDPSAQHQIDALVSELGEFIEVTVGGRSWLVSRHYIALHGLKGSDLASLGFEEVKSKENHVEDHRRRNPF